MKPKRTWKVIDKSDLPGSMRWDTPRANQGQIVTVSYAAWPPSASPADECDMYSRTHDAGVGGGTTYERRTCCSQRTCWGH